MRYSLRLAAIVLFLAVTALPQQPADKKEPPENCGNLNTQMEITNCWEDLAQKADARLNALFQRVQKAIRAKIAEEKGGPLLGYEQRALEKLRAAELAWIYYRDAQCDAAEQQNEGGSIAPSIHAGCVKHLSDQRTAELQKTYAIYLLAK